MLTLSTEERLALLLNVLGEEASTAAFKSMNPTRAKFIEQLLAEYQTDPPSTEEIDYVVKDFNNYFAFAMDALGPQIQEASSGSVEAEGDGEGDSTFGVREKVAASKPKVRYFTPRDSTGDAVADLNKLDEFQIAKALDQDHPKTVALVLRRLETPLAAAVLEELPEDVYTPAVIHMSHESTVPEPIVLQVLASTFEKANSVSCRKEIIDRSNILAQLMRSLPKEMRNQLIEKLSEENPDFVEKIRSKLYVFDDLLRLDDRDIQKVLGEIETDILIVGLQRANPALVKRLLGNLSKRACQTIEEEMQYKTGVDQSEIDEARESLVKALGRLDESGDITLQ